MLLLKASFIIDSVSNCKENNVFIAASGVQSVLNIKKKKSFGFGRIRFLRPLVLT